MKRMLNDRYPIIIIPGLFGSWGEGIFNNNNRLEFGPAKDIYNPLIKLLIDNGYKPYRDLHVSFYNWRLDNSISAKKYLMPVINRAKKVSKKDKVILICHSMGGLVARSYIQGDQYNNDVDRIIMIGTPNSGAVSSYLFWEGGEISYDTLTSNFLFRAFWNSYLWYLKNTYESDELGLLQSKFPSIKQLLPTESYYGPFLYKRVKYGNKKFIKVRHMYEQNHYLDSLNSDLDTLKSRVENISHITGYGYPTNNTIYVTDNGGNEWMDGKPLRLDKTIDGDGTVVVKSSKLPGIKNYSIKKDHSDIVKYSDGILQEILKLKYNNTIKKDNNTYISLMIKNIKDLNLDINNNRIQNYEIYKCDYITPVYLGNDDYWLIIKGKNIDKCELEIKPIDSRESQLFFSSNKNMIEFKNFKEEKINKKTNLQLI